MNKSTFTRALSGFCRLHNLDFVCLYPLLEAKDFETSTALEFLCRPKDIPYIITELNREADLNLTAKRNPDGAYVCNMQLQSGRNFRIIFHDSLSFMGIPYLSMSEVLQRTVTQNDIRYLDPVDQVLVLLMEGVKAKSLRQLARHSTLMRKTAKENPDALLENLMRLTTPEHALQLEEEINRDAVPETAMHGMGWRFAYMAWKWQGITILPLLARYYGLKIVEFIEKQINQRRKKL